jgi:hypothetical protein
LPRSAAREVVAGVAGVGVAAGLAVAGVEIVEMKS